MHHTSNIAILILAAGSSSRMGTPKQVLPWKKTTLIEHSIKTALRASSNVFVVLGANAELIQNKIQGYSITTILNDNWKKGLGNSISCGVNYIQDLRINFEGILIMLADQPLIGTKHLEELVCQFLIGKEIVTTGYNENKEGVPAIFNKLYFNNLSKLNHDFGAKEIIKHNETFIVEVSNKIVDIDTKEDYERLLSDS